MVAKLVQLVLPYFQGHFVLQILRTVDLVRREAPLGSWSVLIVVAVTCASLVISLMLRLRILCKSHVERYDITIIGFLQ